MHRLWIWTVAYVAACPALHDRLAAQTPAADTAVSVYASADGLRPVRETAVRVAALRQAIVMDFDSITVEDALQRITLKAGLGLSYARKFPQLQQRVSLHALNLTVTEALATVVANTGLDLLAWPSGHVVLVERGRGLPYAQQAAGAVMGQVTDGVTRAPLDQAAVRIEGTGLGAITGADGRYAVRAVPPGTYRVTARRVGYTPLTKTVGVVADSTVTAAFALAAAPTRLNEMVTTAVGDQRRYEVGNTISTINADSVAPTAPITSLTDLISARAPGVEVEETSGLTGSGETVRIRGLTSLELQNDPILIVDGVRQDNAAGGDIGAFNFGGGIGDGSHPTPSRLNDLDFSDIQTIDVLKGPAASTEYGTDAANGVIVITTKHGVVGHPQWRVSAEQTASRIPESFPNHYYSWGHTTDGTHTAVDCPLVPGLGGFGVTNGTCVVDSVTQWNPLNHARTSVFGTGARQRYDLSVSGGSEAVRYFVSGGLTNERGIVQMPAVFQRLASNVGLTLPGPAADANTEDQRSVRANTAIRLGPTVDLAATGAYLSTYQRTPGTTALLEAVTYGSAIRDSAHYYGYGFAGGLVTPLANLSDIGSQQTDRFVGGLTGNWRPLAWLAAHATIGVDHGSQGNTQLVAPVGAYSYQTPALGQATLTSDLYSVDVRATATVPLSSSLRSSSSAGLQLVDSRNAGQTGTVIGITSTNETLNGNANAVVTQLSNRQATLGGYGEEQVALADRLFLTAALRIDAGSGFGSAYHAATYPKASVSWLALNSGPTTVRLRGAFGEAGVQPQNGAGLQLYQLTPIWSGGQAVAGAQLSWPGNSHIAPERTAEFEGGIDLGLWGNRVSLELTGYSKRTQDALVNVNLGADLGSYPRQENIGTVQNTGVEGTLTATLVQARGLAWDVTLTAALNHNRLVSLPPGVGTQVTAGTFYEQFRQAVGYPLYGLWARHASYADVNHDGIIETSEVTLADSASYLGSSQPTREASFATHLGLWRGAVTVNALADYRGGYRIYNTTAETGDIFDNQREGNDPTAPLALQARYAATQLFAPLGGSLFIEDGTFVRFRELGVTYALPTRLAHGAHLASLSLTGAVRNLALWTRYSGVDPEVTNAAGNGILPNPTTGGFALNNQIRFDQGTVPLVRYFVIRLTAGL